MEELAPLFPTKYVPPSPHPANYVSPQNQGRGPEGPVPLSPTWARPVLFPEHVRLINPACILTSLLIFDSSLRWQEQHFHFSRGEKLTKSNNLKHYVIKY